MGLRVRLSVNDVEHVDELRIINRGPIDDEAHLYEWSCDCRFSGHVEHVRSEGAHELLRLVLLDHRNQSRLVRIQIDTR